MTSDEIIKTLQSKAEEVKMEGLEALKECKSISESNASYETGIERNESYHQRYFIITYLSG